MASDPWEERLGETDLAWRKQEQAADGGRQGQETGAGGRGGGRRQEQTADFPFLISHFSFQTEDDHEERGITMKNDQ
jgi:hypothetical protein